MNLSEILKYIKLYSTSTLTAKIFPSYYANEGALYYNPKKNLLKVAGPRTRLQSLNRLGYIEYIGETN